MTSKYLLLAAIAALALPLAPANATDAAEAANPTPGDAATAHRDADQAIIITGVSRRSQDALGGVSVVDFEELSRDVRPSIGETLQSQPGVTASSFGPVAPGRSCAGFPASAYAFSSTASAAWTCLLRIPTMRSRSTR